MKKKGLTIAVLGSHSALDICRGAKDEGLRTLVIAQKGREQTYARYYQRQGGLGCVDECLVLPKFSDILSTAVLTQLQEKNVVFVPHRSFEVYLNFDYEAIEKKFKIPIFGNKCLLKIEERDRHPNQYDLLRQAGIKFPRPFSDPKKIDRLSLVKVLERERGFERAFFMVENDADFNKQAAEKLKHEVFTKAQLAAAVIEEFVVGVNVNFNFFYSPLTLRLELLGTDTRRQTNLEGITRLPASYQAEIVKKIPIKYEEAGHLAVTVLESLLEEAFDLGERFVAASQKLFPPGIIGPFALQTVVTAGPPKKEIVVIDVSPRVPGSPGISATPYSHYLYGHSLSVGRRVAQELKKAIRLGQLKRITT